jgi:6-phosphogluconolactonase
MRKLTMFGVMALLAMTAYGQGRQANLKAGAVYVLTNQTANSVMAFARKPNDGYLTLVDNEPTGGMGNPIAIPPDPPTDALASQGSLVIDEDGEYLYAVDAGSNEITTLEITPHGLEFVGRVGSGGMRPISITVYEDLLYVLNEGGTPNVTGFHVAEDGSLTPIPGATQPLIGGAMADPAQVGFSPDGTFLVVTEKMGNRLDTYQIDQNGVAGLPVANASSGMTPFGFAFGATGGLFVSEAFGAMPGAAALSSYTATTGTGVLVTATGSLHNKQTASCWVVTTNCGRSIFVSNTGSGTISSYSSSRGAVLSLVNAVAANIGPGSAPIDMTISDNGGYLYVTESGLHKVGAFRIGVDGSLSKIGDFGSLPAGAQGIVAK